MSQRIVFPLLTLTLLLAGGCSSNKPATVRPGESRFSETCGDGRSRTRYPLDDTAVRLLGPGDAGRFLPVYDGYTGDPVTGRRLLEAIRGADVILLGETHDDPIAHRLQQRFVAEALAVGGGALSLEMLGRDDARKLDALNADIASGTVTPREVETALAETSITTWPGWRTYYLPSVVAAARAGRPVVAANAPREYVEAARTAGYGFLLSLDARQRALFALPADATAYPGYRQRFDAAMTTHQDVDDPAAQPPTTLPATQPEADDGRMNALAPLTSPAVVALAVQETPTTEPTVTTFEMTVEPLIAPPTEPADVDPFYRAQLVWDATMADSIVTAFRRDGRPVVHLVGSFHGDFDAALPTMLRAKGLRVLVVSFVPESANRLRPEDEDRADVVIYTGRPEQFPRQDADPE